MRAGQGTIIIEQTFSMADPARRAHRLYGAAFTQ
jgi:hypothetical protein